MRFRSITTKLVVICLLLGTISVVCAWVLVGKTLTKIEYFHVVNTEHTEILFLQDYLGSGDWRVEDNKFYVGDVFLGDGTQKNANISPFEDFKQKTGTWCYTMMREPNGKYLRIAGSTKGANGESIVGTYIEDYVAKSLDENGVFDGPANVQGVPMYCLYKAVYAENNSKPIGCIVLGHNISEVEEHIAQLNKNYCVLLYGLILLIIVAFFILMSGWKLSIGKIEDYLARIEHGEIPDEKLSVRNKDEIGRVAESVNAMTLALRKHRDICNDLEVAKRMQLSAVPEQGYKSNHLEICAIMHPAKEVGGDFYNYFDVDDTHVAITIADVAGKGVPASLLMMKAKTLIDSYLKIYKTPKAVLDAVNVNIRENNDTLTFVTIWLGIIDITTGEMLVANAGHDYPFVTKNGHFELLEGVHGFPAGVTDDIRLTNFTVQLQKDDTLFLYTDGVTEAFNVNQEAFGKNALQKVLDDTQSESLQTILDTVQNELSSFVGGNSQSDDITMVVVKYKGN